MKIIDGMIPVKNDNIDQAHEHIKGGDEWAFPVHKLVVIVNITKVSNLVVHVDQQNHEIAFEFYKIAHKLCNIWVNEQMTLWWIIFQ